MFRRRPSPALIVAIMALVVALGGTAIAASRYLITSTAQIKPSVVRAIAAQAKITRKRQIAPGILKELLAPGTNVIQRARSVGPVMTVSAWPWAAVPLTGGTWTQNPEELDSFVGKYSVTLPSNEQCAAPHGKGNVSLAISVDGEGGLQSGIGLSNQAQSNTQEFSLTPLYEPSTAVTRTLTAQAFDNCTTGVHATINSVSIDVIGVR